MGYALEFSLNVNYDRCSFEPIVIVVKLVVGCLYIGAKACFPIVTTL
jgi:hypothetical protein